MGLADHPRPGRLRAWCTLVTFLFAEGRAEEPLIPLRLWSNPVFRVATLLEFLVGFAMFGAMIFLPLYLQTVGRRVGHQFRSADPPAHGRD